MSSLETLPPDQRAVLDLVLRRGRSYNDIAQLLGIDRAAVRARALAAFDVLGPETGIAAESRALITDYLLGQLPDRVAEQTRGRLADQPYERAWARRVASQLESVASHPLPEIPDGAAPRAAPAPEPPSRASRVAPASAPEPSSRAAVSSTAPAASLPRERRPRRPPRLSDRPSSRRGGAIMLGVGVVVVVALVVVLISVLGGGKAKHTPSTPAASAPASSGTTGTTPAGGTTSTTGTGSTTGTTSTQIVAQVNLNSPTASSSTKGIAFVVRAGSAYGIIIEAQDIAANNHNSYAAWLYNSPTDNYRLGFVNPPVGKTGKLQVSSALPTNAGHYRELLLSLETASNPKTPSKIVLEGAFKGVPPPTGG